MFIRIIKVETAVPCVACRYLPDFLVRLILIYKESNILCLNRGVNEIKLTFCNAVAATLHISTGYKGSFTRRTVAHGS